MNKNYPAAWFQLVKGLKGTSDTMSLTHTSLYLKTSLKLTGTQPFPGDCPTCSSRY